MVGLVPARRHLIGRPTGRTDAGRLDPGRPAFVARADRARLNAGGSVSIVGVHDDGVHACPTPFELRTSHPRIDHGHGCRVVIGDRWGVSDEEVARHFPCDDLVPAPVMQAWRGVTVRTTPEQLWPWVLQIRVAPYAYDWIDNLGRRSPQELSAPVEPAVGQHFTTAANRRVGRILSVSPGVQLTGRIGGVIMSYLLVPADDSTRLLLKIVMARGRLVAPLLSVGDLVMARRQLLNFKELAERSPTA